MDEEDEVAEEDNSLALEEEMAFLSNRTKEVVEEISAEFPEGLANAKVEKIAAHLHQRMLREGKITPADLETPEIQEDIMNTAYSLKWGLFVSSMEIPYLVLQW